jgi:hypothetical protein
MDVRNNGRYTLKREQRRTGTKTRALRVYKSKKEVVRRVQALKLLYLDQTHDLRWE